MNATFTPSETPKMPDKEQPVLTVERAMRQGFYLGGVAFGLQVGLGMATWIMVSMGAPLTAIYWALGVYAVLTLPIPLVGGLKDEHFDDLAENIGVKSPVANFLFAMIVTLISALFIAACIGFALLSSHKRRQGVPARVQSTTGAGWVAEQACQLLRC